jgi:hypothetical protein
MFTTKRFVRAVSCGYSLRYIFIYGFSYLLIYYYSFLAHYNKKNISILTDFTYLVPPSCLCGILALRSHDFWEMTLTTEHVFGLFTWKTWKCWMRVHLSWNNQKKITFLVNICKIFPSGLNKYFISDKKSPCKTSGKT